MDLTDAGHLVSVERAASADESSDDSFDHLRYLVDALAAGGLGSACEVVISAAPPDSSLDAFVAHAHRAGIDVMVSPASDVAATIAWTSSMASAGSPVGVVLQSAMRRTQADCASLADHRVRLVKGGGVAGGEALYAQPLEVDKAFVRCARKLLSGRGRASFATRDARLVEIVDAIAVRAGRSRYSFEIAVAYPHQDVGQLSASGAASRVCVPYGPGSRAQLVGGFSEQPRTIAAAVRSLLPGL